MKFAFIAKHRTVWPVAWMCAALGVSRSGFHAWLTRQPNQRTRDDEAILVKACASFVASDRTYGARRVWHDVLAEGVACGLHRIERIMRETAALDPGLPQPCRVRKPCPVSLGRCPPNRQQATSTRSAR